MKKGLFVNQRKAQCSIYESGRMIYRILSKGKEYKLDYFEFDTKSIPSTGYDFYVINWHPHTLKLSEATVKTLSGIKIAIVLEVSLNNPKPFTPPWFDAYMIIDPTKPRTETNYPFPRPIEKVSKLLPILDEKKLVFGSFGFFTGGEAIIEKRFDEIIHNANKLGECIVRINLPQGTFTGPVSTLEKIKLYCDGLRRIAKPNVDLQITHNYMNEEDLVRWCSQHTMNIFPYYRNRPGLSAVTDQAIASGRALAVTKSDTFRHIHQHISYYPQQSYQELIYSTPSGVKKMQEIWNQDSFITSFKELLSDYKLL